MRHQKLRQTLKWQPCLPERPALSIKLEWTPSPCPECLRLDDWFLGTEHGVMSRPAPVPFFPEVHEELTKSWKALFRPGNNIPTPPSSPPSMRVQRGGIWRSQKWTERLRCISARKTPPLDGATQDSRPGPVSSLRQSWQRLTRLLDKLRPPWPSAGLHEGGPNPEVLQELCLATDYASWATKVTAQALGRARSTLVVQECHLWLNVAGMRESSLS